MSDIPRRIDERRLVRATSRDWAFWFDALDRFDVAKRGHTEAAAHLGADHGVSPWWAQTIVVTYERERGIREHLQTSRGYEISVSRTISAPIERVFSSWSTAKELNRWFSGESQADFRVGGKYRNADGDFGEYLKIELNKRIRFSWENSGHCPGTVVEVLFEQKKHGRTWVSVGHLKLASRADALDMKEGWSWAMDNLKLYLESGKTIKFEDWRTAKAVKRAPSSE